MSVELRPGESQDSLLKRFRKAVAEARILPIVRQKRWFTPKSEVKRISVKNLSARQPVQCIQINGLIFDLPDCIHVGLSSYRDLW